MSLLLLSASRFLSCIYNEPIGAPLDIVRLLLIITSRAVLSVDFWAPSGYDILKVPKIHRKSSSARDNDQKPHCVQHMGHSTDVFWTSGKIFTEFAYVQARPNIRF